MRRVCAVVQGEYGEEEMTFPFNTESDGTSRTIKANYFKKGAYDVLDISTQGANYKATGAIVIYE